MDVDVVVDVVDVVDVVVVVDVDVDTRRQFPFCVESILTSSFACLGCRHVRAGR